jgi:hypothetical protein
MNDTSSANRGAPVASSGPSQVPPAPPRPRATARKAPERRRGPIIGGGILLIAALGAVVALATGHPASVRSVDSTQTAGATPDNDLRAAKITSDLGEKGCSQQVFDNQTGRMTRSQQPCETTAYDSNGVPIPRGTIHRLEAISKGFSSH